MLRTIATRLLTLWAWRELIATLVVSDLRLRYKGSTLGVFWSLLNPLALAAVYTVALQYIIRIRMEHYALFLISGVLPWVFFSTAVSVSANSISGQGHLIKKMAFPREILPLVGVLSQLIHFTIGYLLVVPAFAYFQVGIGRAFLALPAVILLLFIFTSGLALAVASAQVYYRDTQHLLNVILQLWFWLTPILYSLQFVPERFRPLALANPLTLYISTYQEIVVERSLPDLTKVGLMVAVAVVSLVAGYVVFMRGERRFAEHV